MAALGRLISRHPLTWFVVLAYALSWWPWLLYAQQRLDAVIIGFGPFFAAVIVLGFTVGWSGVKALLRQMVQWRVGLRWYLAALGLPIVLSTLAVVLAVLLGAPRPTTEQLATWPNLISTFFILLLVPGLGGTWEEPGWRGYLLPRLDNTRSRLGAALILWVIIVCWHIPLFVTSKIVWGDIPNMLGATIVINWIFYRTGGSVLLIMLLHAMNNTVAGEYFSPMFTGAAADQYGWMRALVWMVAALIVVLADLPFWTTSPAAPAIAPQATSG
jgi:membrane protease YdiL (CAAX protease family)